MQIAAGFGLQTCDLNNEADPQAALQAIIDRPGPALIHVRIDAQQKVYPMVPPGAANTEMVGNKPCKNTVITSSGAHRPQPPRRHDPRLRAFCPPRV